MNYRHIYHAGNFADIFKHLILVAAINRLHKKATPYTILDLYAGRGLYQLDAIEAQKTLEASQGITALVKHCAKPSQDPIPLLIQQFLQIVRGYNSKTDIVSYPGSPLISSHLLASNAKLQLSELHSEDFEGLRREIGDDSQVECVHCSAEQMLLRSLPLRHKRGLIVIDPAFEDVNEFQNIIGLCKVIEQRALNTPVIIWYPIKNKDAIKNYTSNLKKMNFKEILRATFTIPANLVRKSYNGDDGMNQCGVDIINPGDLQSTLNENLMFLKKLYKSEATISISYL